MNIQEKKKEEGEQQEGDYFIHILQVDMRYFLLGLGF